MNPAAAHVVKTGEKIAREKKLRTQLTGGTQPPYVPNHLPLSKNKIKSMKKGGKVHRTGIYKLHKGETVVPAKQSPKMLSISLEPQFPKSKKRKS